MYHFSSLYKEKGADGGSEDTASTSLTPISTCSVTVNENRGQDDMCV